MTIGLISGFEAKGLSFDYRPLISGCPMFIKVKLSPKCNLGVFCECISFKPLNNYDKRGTFKIYCTFMKHEALRTLFVYTEFAKKRVFEQLTLAVACSARSRHGSREVSISKCDVTWRRVKVECYCLPATTIHARSHVTFPAFYFSTLSDMSLLFQLKGQYCLSQTTKQWSIVHLYGTKL